MEKQIDVPDFPNLAINSFGFLKNNHHFNSTIIGSETVEFRNKWLNICIFREPVSLLIYVQIHVIGTEVVLLLDEILATLAPEKAVITHCSGSDPKRTDNCLYHLSKLCTDYLTKFFDGDFGFLKQITKQAYHARSKYTLDCQYGPTLKKANSAWENKDWDLAKKLYLECFPALSIADKRRLEYLNNQKP